MCLLQSLSWPKYSFRLLLINRLVGLICGRFHKATMLTSTLWKEARTLQTLVKRNYGVSAVLLQKASDPIQQLFVDKIREYAQKKKAAGGKFVDSSPEVEKQLNQELDKVAKHYGGGPGVDMTKFPAFKFDEPTIDPQV